MSARIPHTIRKMPRIHCTKDGHIRIKMPATMAKIAIVVPLTVKVLLAIKLNLLRSDLMLILLIFRYSVNNNTDLTGGV